LIDEKINSFRRLVCESPKIAPTVEEKIIAIRINLQDQDLEIIIIRGLIF